MTHEEIIWKCLHLIDKACRKDDIGNLDRKDLENLVFDINDTLVEHLCDSYAWWDIQDALDTLHINTQ